MDDTDKMQAFGQFLVEHLRDRAFEHFDLLQGANASLNFLLQERLRTTLAPWNAEQQETVRLCISQAVEGAIHDFLFALQEIYDHTENPPSSHHIQILVDGTDIVELSDGIYAEMHGEDGWIQRYSTIPSYSDVL